MTLTRTSRLRVLTALGGVLATSLLLPDAAGAHGLVGRADLPIPSWMFAWVAAIVLVISFVALATLWPQPRLQHVEPRPLFRIPGVVDWVCGAIGVGLFALVVYSGYAGTSVATSNLAPTFIYVHFWVGVVILSVLLGDVFRAFNPWLATARLVAWLGGGRLRAPLQYPAWLGRWPAAISILIFAWIELAYNNKDIPSTLATLALVYAVVQLVGMALFGIEAWSRNADGFGVYFSLLSRLSALVRQGQVLCTRRFLSGAPEMPVVPGSLALLCVAIGSTTFDGFSNGLWKNASPDVAKWFSDLGAGPATAVQWASTLGLIGCILVISGFYWLGVTGMHTIDDRHSTGELAGRFAHTLIPIAFAYALAHYFSLLVFQGQAAGYLISDPLGNGANIFGTANIQINYNVISNSGIWYVQVGALLVGHVCGLTLAHDRALAVYQRVRDAARSQYWMLVVMVGFTSLGLWLLSAVSQ